MADRMVLRNRTSSRLLLVFCASPGPDAVAIDTDHPGEDHGEVVHPDLLGMATPTAMAQDHQGLTPPSLLGHRPTARSRPFNNSKSPRLSADHALYTRLTREALPISKSLMIRLEKVCQAPHCRVSRVPC